MDASYCFLDICVRWPGSVYDARAFVYPSLHKKITDNQLTPDKTERIGSVDVPLYMIDDSAYPLQSWLMKSFTCSSDLATQQHTYNYGISRGTKVAENAFGQLKA